MPASMPFCMAQINRLARMMPILRPSNKPGDPNASDEWTKEMAAALRDSCESNEHAEKTVTALLKTCPETKNVMFDLVRIAGELMRPRERVPDACSSCPPGDWIYVTAENGVEAGKRCTCARGRWLARNRPEVCPRCGDIGFEIVQDSKGRDAARPCPCGARALIRGTFSRDPRAELSASSEASEPPASPSRPTRQEQHSIDAAALKQLNGNGRVH